MKYAYSFLTLMGSLEGILGGAVLGQLADSITLAVVPSSPDFAAWMTTFDRDVARKDDRYTPDEINMKLVTDEDGRQYLEAPKIGDMEVLPYMLHINEEEYFVMCENADSRNCEPEERKLDWVKPSEFYTCAEYLTKKLIPVREQHHEDYFWYVNQDIDRRDIRYKLEEDNAITLYFELCSMLSEDEARLEAEFFIRVEGQDPTAAAKLAASVIEKFAVLSDGWVQADRGLD